MEIELLNGGIAPDDRGYVSFVNDFNPAERGIQRFYQVENIKRDFVRAWHGHLNEHKYVYVPKGTVLIGACPILSQPTELGPPQKFVLSDRKPAVLHIPAGYANGFKTLTENAVVLFYSTSSLEDSLKDDVRFAWNCSKHHAEFWKEEYR